MKNNMNDLSIIMPAFNESLNIRATVTKCFSELNRLDLQGEVIVTEDGSSDNTLDILTDLSNEHSNLKVVVHEQNEGYGAALKDAAKEAKCDFIASIDSDGQFDISEVSILADKMREGYDVVTGFRKKKKDSFFKVMANRGLNIVTRILFGVKYKDTNCALKLYRKGVLDTINIEAKGYQAPTEILVKLSALGFKIGEVGISHFFREKGKSALSPFRTIYQMLIFLFYLKLKICLYSGKIIKNL